MVDFEAYHRRINAMNYALTHDDVQDPPATLGLAFRQIGPGLILAASIVGKCHYCVGSHYALLKNEGLTTQQLRDIGRIAAVVSAAAQVLAVK